MTVDVEARLRSDLPRVVALLADRHAPPPARADAWPRGGRVVGIVVALAAVVFALIVYAVRDAEDRSGSQRIDTAGSVARPETKTGGWTPLPSSGLGGRANTAVVWTGSEVVVWGGTVGSMFYQQGVAYNPTEGVWRPIASNRGAAPGVLNAWTGRRMYVVIKRSGAMYDVASDAWRDIGYLPDGVRSGFGGLTWSGSDLYGTVAGSEGLRVARYDDAQDRWILGAAFPGAGGFRTQDNHASWIRGEVVVWNGSRAGWAYRPSSDSWRALPRLDDSLPGVASDLVVVNDQPVVVYGYDGPTGRTLAVARLDGDAWHTVLEATTPDLARPIAVTDGADVYVIDGSGVASPLRIDMVTYTITELGDFPLSPAEGTQAVWAGSGLFVWGGLPTGSVADRPEAAWYNPSGP